jgi:hypothetical protein
MAKARNKKRLMDEDRPRRAQLWWTFGVAVVLAMMAMSQSSPRLQAQSERIPAQWTPSKALPDSGYRFKQ